MEGLKSWRMDFDNFATSDRRSNSDPPGYDAALAKDNVLSSSQHKRKDPQSFTKKQTALWERAFAPVKQVMMMCVMIYMFCGSIQIFSLFFLVTGMTTPITAIIKSGEAFPATEDSKKLKLDLTTPRLLYCVVHFGQLVFVLWRLNAIGLLPTHASDWLSTLPVPLSAEHSFAAI